MGSKTRKLLLMLLLLCFQTQTLAAVVLPCIHGSGEDAVADLCHQPAVTAQEIENSNNEESPYFDCHKCQLGCTFGTAALPFGRFVAPVSENSPVIGPAFLRHFYRFVSDPLQRPPISLLS